MSHISCKCQRNSCEVQIQEGVGGAENNGGQITNESVTNPLPNLRPMSAAQRRQWHSSWPLVVRLLWDEPSPRSIRGMEINLPLLANAGPFTTGSVNHEDNNYCVVFWGVKWMQAPQLNSADLTKPWALSHLKMTERLSNSPRSPSGMHTQCDT